MVDPAKIKSVLSKASDQQLMSMLKKPDMIPSMFVQQEIARRNKMRQASKAQLQTLSNSMKPTLPVQLAQNEVTPRGQNINPQTEGGITYMKPGGRVTPKYPSPRDQVAFAKESGGAIGDLNEDKQANLIAWLKRRQENPKDLKDVDMVIRWMDMGVINPQKGVGPQIRKLAKSILVENDYNPRDPGGLDHKGFVQESLFPVGKKIFEALTKIPGIADRVLFGKDGIKGYAKEIVESYKLDTGNIYNEDNPAPSDPIKNIVGYDQASEFKRLEEADQPRPQDFLAMQEAERMRANRSAMADAARYQGMGDRARVDAMNQEIDSLREGIRAIPSNLRDAYGRARNIAGQAIDQVRGNAPLPPENADPSAKLAFGRPREREMERLRMEGINEIPAPPSTLDRLKNWGVDSFNTLKDEVGTIEDYKNSFQKAKEFIGGKRGLNKEFKDQVITPLKRYNPMEGGEEFIISPEENQTFIPPQGISSLDQKVKDARDERMRRRQLELKGRQKYWLDEASKAEKLRNMALTTNYGENFNERNFENKPQNDYTLDGRRLNRYNYLEPGATEVSRRNLDVDANRRIADDQRIHAKNIQYKLDRGGYGLNPNTRRDERRYGIERLYDKDSGVRTINRGDQTKKVNLSPYGTDLARIMEGQSFGQDYRTGPSTPEDYKNFQDIQAISQENKANESTHPILNAANDAYNFIGSGIEKISDSYRYGKPQDWKAREEAMLTTPSEPSETDNKVKDAVEELGNNFTTKISPNSNTYKDTKRFDNQFKQSNDKKAKALTGDSTMTKVVNTPEGSKLAGEYKSLTDAQNKLIDAMKPAGEANNRFWGLVASFGAKLTANDWQDALNQTMAEFKDMKAADKANFVEMAKMGYGFEKDKLDHSYKLAALAQRASSAANQQGLGQLRIKQDRLDTKVKTLSLLYKENEDSLSDLQDKRMLEPENWEKESPALLEKRNRIASELEKLNSGADLSWSSTGGLTGIS